MMKPKVAFICVHNSCRSQMAEMFGVTLAKDVFESYSAGTETRANINEDAVRIIKEMYNIDMTKNQSPKLIDDIPEVDVVIKMGCNVVCPDLASKHEEDWGIEDPSGKSDEEFRKTAKIIEEKVRDLARRISEGELILS